MKLLKLLLANAETNNIKNIDELLEVNPKQIINNVNLNVVVHKVNYSYTTIKGNPKRGEKYFLLNGLNPQKDMKIELERYIDNFNKKYPYRKLSNVKFLDSQCLGYLTL